MTKAEKNEEIKLLQERIQKSKFYVVATFNKLNVEQVTDFRKKLHGVDAEYKVSKNTLFNIAAGDSAKALKDLSGPNGVVFAYSDVVAVAKVLKEFSGIASDAFKVKSVVFEGKQVDASALSELADLPSREVLLSKLLGVLQNPTRNFVGVLAAVPRSFVQVLAAIQKKKEETQA